MKAPIAELDIKKGYQHVLAFPHGPRTYFKLVFNKKTSLITTERTVPMQKVFNFRDIGGYKNKEGRSIKWGKIYRSSSLARASFRDNETLHQLNIESVIDLRAKRDSYSFPTKFQPSQIYNLPLRGNPYNLFFDEILSLKMTRSDILLYDQNLINFILENNSDYFIKMFDILLNENNYPVVIYCYLGKDRAAIASALILSVLDVDYNLIIDDYLMSNNLIEYNSLVANADMYPYEVQETITALYSAHRESIKNSFDVLKEHYGSVDNYLEKELGLNDRKKEKLKNLLLY